MNMIKTLFKRMVCNHKYDINACKEEVYYDYSGYRVLKRTWVCELCGKHIKKKFPDSYYTDLFTIKGEDRND